MEAALSQYVLFAALLFSVGLYAALTRRNAVIVLLAIELMLAAALINLVAFSSSGPAILTADVPDARPAVSEQVFALMIIAVAAAEVAVGLAVLIALYRLKATPNVDMHDTLKH
ncbi:MAG: NADH-quinone oxidoreductase subunit NuoK [Hydrogenibacillus sp.]|nr:NADH-quinone oxidoreductase subunit NuoK [Hydrogenibacillus sp.]